MTDGVFDNLTVNGELICNRYDANGNLLGRLHWGDPNRINELSLEGFGDPPKVRLAADGGSLGAVSFNFLRPDGVHEEVFLIVGKESEDAPGSLGGQIEVFCRRENDDGDQAMVRVAVISPALGPDGEPRVYIDNPDHTLGPWGFGNGGGDPGSLVLHSKTNLNGTASDLEAQDAAWLEAAETKLDTGFSATPAGSGSTGNLQVRRTQSGGTSPYLYVFVDGVKVVDAYQLVNTEEIVTFPYSSGIVDVQCSAQDGTLEYGALTLS